MSGVRGAQKMGTTPPRLETSESVVDADLRSVNAADVGGCGE